jgi:long-chain acyl-CoA synthetase
MKQTIPQFFENSVRQFPDNIYLKEKTADIYTGTRYKDVKLLVKNLAAGFYSIGLRKGDRVALMCEGRNAWVIAELAMLYIGVINVPLSVKLVEEDEIIFRLRHSGVKFVAVSENQAVKVRSFIAKLTGTGIINFDLETGSGNELSYAELLIKGDSFLNENQSLMQEVFDSVKPDDAANICYTSGTTADPKGIILTHSNYISNVNQSYTLMDIPPTYTTLLILPWDHSFAHTCGIYCMMGKGASLASVKVGKTGMETLKNIPGNIKEMKPNLLLSVPALATNFRKNIEKGIQDKGKIINGIFKHALKISYKYNDLGFNKGKGFTFLYKPLIALYDKILFTKIREGFGGNLEYFVGGGALLDIELQRFFYAVGMPMYQGYGLTEASPVISSNSARKHKLGSSGILAGYLDLKILDEKGNEMPVGEKGEIVIRGGNVMAGYWNNADATTQTIKDGWLHTGDLGFMDNDGFLYVLGRFKSLLIGDDGEKYSPEGIEEAIVAQSEFIEQCMLYNNQNAYTTSLIYPNTSALKRFLETKQLAASTDEGIKAALQKIEDEIDEYKHNGKFQHMFPHRWLPAAIGVLGEGFTEDNHMMNSTMKMVRGKITEYYRERINFLYTHSAKEIANDANIQAMKKLLG